MSGSWAAASVTFGYVVRHCFVLRVFGLISVQATIPGIDDILGEMTNDTATRLSAKEVLDKLISVVGSMPPASLLIAPDISTQDDS